MIIGEKCSYLNYIIKMNKSELINTLTDLNLIFTPSLRDKKTSRCWTECEKKM